MSVVLICAPMAATAMNPSFGLARLLQSHGHDVWYVGVRDCQTHAVANGFRFWPFLAPSMPHGYEESWRNGSSIGPLRRLAARRRNRRREADLLKVLIEHGRPELAGIASHLRPRLCLIIGCYIESTMWALLAHHAGLRCAYLGPGAPSGYAPSGRSGGAVPPVNSSIVPTDTAASRLAVALSWRAMRARQLAGGWRNELFGLAFGWDKGFLTLAKACRYDPRLLERRDIVSPRLRLPELVVWPRGFDFPTATATAAASDRHYIWPGLDRCRTEASFPWWRIDPSRPLLYCSLGSQPGFLTTSQYRTLLRSIVEASDVRPHWQWVVSTGGAIDPEDLALGPGNVPENVPENVIVVRQAPQLAMLERARLLITHGGANSVKESLCFGVPMVIFPTGFDHRGMAARVRFHGAGLVGDPRKVSAAMVRKLVARVDDTPAIRAKALLMRRRFRDAEDEAAAVRAVEALMG